MAGRKPNASGQIRTPGPPLRVNEGGVAGSVRSLDLDIGLDDFSAGCRSRSGRRGEASGH